MSVAGECVYDWLVEIQLKLFDAFINHVSENKKLFWEKEFSKFMEAYQLGYREFGVNFNVQDVIKRLPNNQWVKVLLDVIKRKENSLRSENQDKVKDAVREEIRQRVERKRLGIEKN